MVEFLLEVFRCMLSTYSIVCPRGLLHRERVYKTIFSGSKCLEKLTISISRGKGKGMWGVNHHKVGYKPPLKHYLA